MPVPPSPSGVLSIVIGLAAALWPARSHAQPTRVTIDENNVLVLNGQRVFPIGFTMAPAPGAKAPNGNDGMKEIRQAGGLFTRTGPMGGEGGSWDQWIDQERRWHAAAHAAGLYVAPWLKEYSHLPPDAPAKEAGLRALIEEFKDSPALLVWKGEDEPEWGKKPVPPMTRVADLVHRMDPNHPIWIVQAPRGTVDTLRAYDPTYDITGVDIYPISYPPGAHSLEPNKDISMVGDFTRRMMDVAGPKKPVWLTLQIAWSGVAKPGRTLRFPTLHQSRFMAYQAVINGARGLVFFGGQLPTTLSADDAKLGWNWTFWERALKPVVVELGTQSPLVPALVAPDSGLKLTLSATEEIRKGDNTPPQRRPLPEVGVEYLIRETDDALYLLACRLPGPTALVTFDGLPTSLGEGEVMFESPRKIAAKDGAFADWFAPHDVHVYRFPKQ
jgi:hypothetical protein